MLHFAAKFGLEKLLWHLLESPGGEQACQLRNSWQMTPADVAEASNHQKLAQALRGYMQMTELTSMYSILKGISDGHQPPPPPPRAEDPDVNYLLPRPLDDSYLVPPAPRPVVSPHQPPHSAPATTVDAHNYTNVGSPLTSDAAMFNYQVPPPPQSIFATNYQVPTNGRPYGVQGGAWSPATPSSPIDCAAAPPSCGYLEMSSNGGKHCLVVNVDRRPVPLLPPGQTRDISDGHLFTVSNFNPSSPFNYNSYFSLLKLAKYSFEQQKKR